MTNATCVDCDHAWETDQPADELRERPECPECGSSRVDVQAEGGWYMVWR